MAAYVKSVIYLGTFGALGYVLMKLTEPSEEKIKQFKQIEGYGTESQRKKALFIEQIKKATYETPIYLRRTDQKPESKSQPKPEEKAN